MVRRTRAAVLTLAMINVFTLAAGITVARMLPPRLAALRVPTVAAGRVDGAGAVLAPGTAGGSLPTASGLRAALAGPLSVAALGPQVAAMVADPATGKVLLSQDGARLLTPASTTKLVTSVAALAALGPDATFTTRVVHGATPDHIIVVGGGDPTLAVNQFPAQDYPQPATLASLAAATARALKSQGRTTVSIGYDTSLYTGPALASGWPQSYITTGNVTPIVSLEVDQGRLTTAGTPEDSDDPDNLRPRTTDPAGMAAASFAALLAADGIHVTGSPVAQAAPAHAAEIASVSSPPLSAIVDQMLEESNNVIAENLARQVALATGQPASFSGAAAAVTGELRRLAVSTGLSLVDGSGLSPQDAIAPTTLVKVVELATADARVRSLLAGLPVAGFSGTLSAGQSVFAGIGGAALGSVRAKTGNLGTVTALAGLVTDKNGTTLAFAVMADQIPTAGMLRSAANAIDEAAVALANCGCRLRALSASTYRWTVSSTQMIDWDIAISTGTRWARPGPQVSLAEARRTVSELRDLAGAVQQPVYEVTGIPAGVGDDRGGIAGHRHPGRADPGLPVLPGAWPVRAVPAAGGLAGRRRAAGQAHPGGPQHRHGRARARRGLARLPALGVPARGDAPAAVHRGALAAGLRAEPDDRVPARLRARPGGHPAADPVGGRRDGGRGARRRRRQPDRRRGHPAAARDHGPADRGDDAGGRARRLRHGRGRAAGGALGRADPGAVRAAGSSRRSAAFSASSSR